jgi:hypothetical protein
MTRASSLAASALALALTIGPAPAAEKPSNAGPEDCESRMQALDRSDAEGEERLAVKNHVIAFCARQYQRDAAIGRLVKECAKYLEQPVLKQQFVADCQLAAFGYANALRALKLEFGK